MCREPVHTIVRKYTETPTEERTFPEHSAPLPRQKTIKKIRGNVLAFFIRITVD
jgi:hypothetical protein